MRRNGKDQLDLAHVGGKADTATHMAEDRIERVLAQPWRCIPSWERLENTIVPQGPIGAEMFFTFPENAHWNAEQQAIEFGVEIGEYRGVVRVPRRVFQRLLPERPTPERCVEAYYLQRTGTRGSPSGSCGGVVGRGRQSGD